MVEKAQAEVRAKLDLRDFMVETRLVFTARGSKSLDAQERSERHKVHKRIKAGIPQRDAQGQEIPNGRVFYRDYRDRYARDAMFREDCEKRGRGVDWMDIYEAELEGITPRNSASTATPEPLSSGESSWPEHQSCAERQDKSSRQPTLISSLKTDASPP